MLGKERKGGGGGGVVKKPGVWVKETQGSTRKVLCWCKRPGEISRISVWV